MADKWLLQDGSGHWQLQDGSGDWLLQASAAADGGHFLFPYTEVRIERAEPPPPLVDHHSRLFFGRAVTAAPAAPQRLWFWREPSLETDSERIARPAHDALHRYRTGYQTVGQPWWALRHAVARPVEPEAAIVQPQHPLYRQYAAAAVAPPQRLWLWSEPRLPPPPEDVRPVFHLPYRLYPVAVAPPQRLWLWARSSVQADERIIVPTAHDLFALRRAAPRSVQPWWLWPRALTAPGFGELFARTDHDGALYPFRPHNAITPLPYAPALPRPGRTARAGRDRLLAADPADRLATPDRTRGASAPGTDRTATPTVDRTTKLPEDR